MWAAMPMLRVRSSGNLRSGEFGFVEAGFFSIVAVAIKLPAEMRKSAVGLRHLMRVFAFFDRVALTGGGVLDFLGERISHRPAPAIIGVLHDPPHRERDLPRWRNFHWRLIGRAPNPTRFYFQAGSHILQRLV